MSAAPNPLDVLCERVREALERYNASGDHKHAGGPVPGDCVSCALFDALPEAQRPAKFLKCPTCGAQYLRETMTGIRLCRRCKGPVNASPDLGPTSDWKEGYEFAAGKAWDS